MSVLSPDPFPGRSKITAEEYIAAVGSNEVPSEAHHVAPQRVSAPKIRENAFRDAVVALARYRGFLVYFTWRSDHSPAGFPDLVMVRHDRLLFAELKVKPNRLTPAQVEWIAALDRAGAETHIWYPEDFETIEEVLA